MSSGGRGRRRELFFSATSARQRSRPPLDRSIPVHQSIDRGARPNRSRSCVALRFNGMNASVGAGCCWLAPTNNCCFIAARRRVYKRTCVAGRGSRAPLAGVCQQIGCRCDRPDTHTSPLTTHRTPRSGRRRRGSNAAGPIVPAAGVATHPPFPNLAPTARAAAVGSSPRQGRGVRVPLRQQQHQQ